MAKPELGLKRVCVNCAARFYDLLRAPAICPKCATEQPAEQPRIRRIGGAAAAAAAAAEEKRKRAAAAAATAGEEVELEEVEGEAVEDSEELEDDAEDIPEEIEVEGDTEEET